MGNYPAESQKSNIAAARRLAVVAFIGLVLAIALAGGKTRKSIQGDGLAHRVVASQPFPRHPRLRDEDEILERYRDYLVFAVSIGRSTNSSQARDLMDQFSKLEKESPTHAAQFLKGLKYEMDQKVEILGLVPSRVYSSHPRLRPWVGKFLPVWLREVDEARFRAYTDKLIAKRRRSE
jgi:hypothetical protein